MHSGTRPDLWISNLNVMISGGVLSSIGQSRLNFAHLANAAARACFEDLAFDRPRPDFPPRAPISAMYFWITLFIFEIARCSHARPGLKGSPPTRIRNRANLAEAQNDPFARRIVTHEESAGGGDVQKQVRQNDQPFSLNEFALKVFRLVANFDFHFLDLFAPDFRATC